MRISVRKWEMMIVLCRLELIEMIYASEFDEDSLVAVGISVHPNIVRNMKI